ncbi:MAG: hypothetical protein QMB94_04700, partial [Phycisphaerales bacterium]
MLRFTRAGSNAAEFALFNKATATSTDAVFDHQTVIRLVGAILAIGSIGGCVTGTLSTPPSDAMVAELENSRASVAVVEV